MDSEKKKSWKKENMKLITAVFKKEFVDQYKEACKKLNVKQSEPIRKAMEQIIRKGAK